MHLTNVGFVYFIIINSIYSYGKICLSVLEFYGPVKNEIMSSRSVNSGTVPGQA